MTENNVLTDTGQRNVLKFKRNLCANLECFCSSQLFT